MSEYDAHHAVLTANLILDKAVLLHPGCQQLKVLLERLGVEESYRTIIEVGSKAAFAQPMLIQGLGGLKDYRKQKTEEISAYNRVKDEVFAECRALVQKFKDS